MGSNQDNCAGTAPETGGAGTQACRVEAEAAAETAEAYALQCEVSSEAAPTFVSLLRRCKDMQVAIALMLNEVEAEGDLLLLEELRVAMGAIAASLRAQIEAARQSRAPASPPEQPAPPKEPPPASRSGGRGRR